MRNFYSSFCGINYALDGLIIRPCVSHDFGDFNIEFEYLGNKFKVNYYIDETKRGKMALNGKQIDVKVNVQSGKEFAFIEDCEFKKSNVIDVWY